MALLSWSSQAYTKEFNCIVDCRTSLAPAGVLSSRIVFSENGANKTEDIP